VEAARKPAGGEAEVAAPTAADLSGAPASLLVEALTPARVLALQRTAGNRLVTQWLQGNTLARDPVTAEADEAKKKQHSFKFPWAGAPAGFVKDYLDEHADGVAVNLFTGTLYIALDTGVDVEIPLASVQGSVADLTPMLTVHPSLAVAQRFKPELRAEMETRGMHPCLFYRGQGNVIWPTIISEETLPRVMATYPAALEAARADVKATQDTFVDLLLWYVGARLPIRTQRAPLLPGAGKVAPAVKAAFDAGKLADELLSATSSLKAPGRMMLEAAKRLSAMENLTAVQKVSVIESFFQRIGFAISKAGVVDEGASFVMYSEDSRYAFRFVKDGGKILYAKFDMAAMNYVWTAL
jgi:hypothetical protein